MIKLIGLKQVPYPGKNLYELFADTKEEVVEGATIVGLPEDYSIPAGSKITIADGTIGYYKSDNTWSWVKSGGGKDPVLIEKSITENGEYSAADDEADGYSSVSVDVEPDLTTKTITENGTYQASSDNVDGYSEVTVALPLDSKTITENGTYTASTDNLKGYSSVTVNVSSSGSSGDNVKFYDYDGTPLYSYSKEEFLEMTALPSNPSHAGLTAQGWNWTLNDIKTQLNYGIGVIIVGQSYITSDGKTRIHISLSSELTFVMRVYVKSSCTIDWGDNSPLETVEDNHFDPNIEHEYTSAGDYIITLELAEAPIHDSNQLGGFGDPDNDNYSYYWVKEVYLGNNIVIGNCACSNCVQLESITIPNNTGISGLDATFGDCSSLKAVIIPNSVVYIEDLFTNCGSLKVVSIPKEADDLGEGKVIENCNSLTDLVVTGEYTDFSSYRCNYSLTNVAFLYGISEIGTGHFYESYCLKTVTVPESVTEIGDEAFYCCYSLQSVTLPTTIENSQLTGWFYKCYSLKSVDIPEGITIINSGSFSECKSLTSLSLPSTLTKIESDVFYGCKSLLSITCKAATPPSTNDSFYEVPTSCTVYVPQESVSDYEEDGSWGNFVIKAIPTE